MYFGTNNVFTFKDVQNRWKTIRAEASKQGITILGFSGDGDSRILKAMEINAKLGTAEKNTLGDFSAAEEQFKVFYIQDTVHIITKLRNRMFKANNRASRNLPIGNCTITIDHIRSLTSMLPKDVHLIQECDLDGKDRMNYESAERLCNSNIQDLLAKNVLDSEGTRLYLKIMELVKLSFLSEDFDPKERLFNLWLAAFILRIWRDWITRSQELNLSDHFITRNTYICIELNAHALTLIVLNPSFKFDSSKEFFLPKLLSSQPCEQFFRNLRSMTSTQSTVVNFSMLDVLYRIKRIDLQEALNLKLTDEGIYLPRYQKRLMSTQQSYHLGFTMEEVVSVIENARTESLIIMNGVGIDPGHSSTIFKAPMIHSDLSENLSELEDEEIEFLESLEETSDIISENEDYSEGCHDSDTFTYLEGPFTLKNYGNLEHGEKVDPKCPYVAIQTTTSSKPRLIKKSSLVWRLRKQAKHVSNDRQTRFHSKS